LSVGIVAMLNHTAIKGKSSGGGTGDEAVGDASVVLSSNGSENVEVALVCSKNETEEGPDHSEVFKLHFKIFWNGHIFLIGNMLIKYIVPIYLQKVLFIS